MRALTEGCGRLASGARPPSRPSRRYNRAHGPPCDPDPRRRHRAGAGGGDHPRPRCDRHRLRMGVRRGRRGGDRRARDAAPGRRPRVGPAEQGRPQGPDHHARSAAASGASTSRFARRSGCTPTCARRARWRASSRATRTSTWSSSARTPRTSTPASSTWSGRDAAESIKIITREASERIARFAFEYAVANGRHKVTAVHKANIMKLSDGLFLESCRTVAADYDGPDRVRGPDRRQHVHAARPEARAVRRAGAAEPVRRHRERPAAGLVGGLGVAPGANIGTEAAVFEPVHGSAPKYAGLDKANPTAMILSGALMLRHLGYPEEAGRLETAVRDVIAEGRRDDLRPRRHDRARRASPTRSSSASARRPRPAAR